MVVKCNQFIDDDNLTDKSSLIHLLDRHDADDCDEIPLLKHSPFYSENHDEISKATSDHKRRQWREFVESIDHRTDSTKLWRTIKGTDSKSNQTKENEGITITG